MRRTYGLVSILIGIPCVWQRHIQAGDLSSHLYNAWLVNQVSDGQLPGLYIVPQFTNVLFDYLLSFLMRLGGPLIAEKVAVLLAVEIFFWGCFTFASVMADRPAWNAAPFLAIAAYGAVFRMGFFNFYMAVGLCAWAIALVWRNHHTFRWLAIPIFVLACFAHVVPCLWAFGVLAYLWIVRRLKNRYRYWLLAGGVAAVATGALFIKLNFPARWASGLPIDSLLGADQVLIYGGRYWFLEAALLIFILLLLARRWEFSPPLELLLLNAAATLLLPGALWISHLRFTYIGIRLSLLSMILFCAVIARAHLQLVEKAISGALLVVFVVFAFSDERSLNLIEGKIANAVAALPEGGRVISTVANAPHLIDRVCIGHCFDFANYEPATEEFRLRARPGNPYVMTNIEDILHLENTEYVWRNRDVYLFLIGPCSRAGDFCVDVVHPGDTLRLKDIQMH